MNYKREGIRTTLVAGVIVILISLLGCGRNEDRGRDDEVSEASFPLRSITQYSVEGDSFEELAILSFHPSDWSATVMRTTSDGKVHRSVVASLRTEVFDELYTTMVAASQRVTNNTVVLSRDAYYGYLIDGDGWLNYIEFEMIDAGRGKPRYYDLIEEALRHVVWWGQRGLEGCSISFRWETLESTREMRNSSADPWPQYVSDALH